MADNENLARGRRAKHKPACGCPACGWRRRTAEDKAFLENASPRGAERDDETMRLLDEARRDMEGRMRVSEAERQQAQQRSTSASPSSSSSAPAEKPGSLSAPLPGGRAGGPGNFPVDPVGGSPGSPTFNDRPAAGAVVSPAPASAAPPRAAVAPAPARPEGASLWCRGCGALVRDALWSGHACACQPAHVAMRWSARPV